MIKKVIFSMAAMAFLTFSCTRSEMENQNIPTPDAISLNPNTAITRAAIMDLDTLKNDANGFVVYADTAAGTSWYSDGWNFIDGTNNHVFVDNGWKFSSPVLWPSSGYPMAFLAYYPGDAASQAITGITATAPTSPTTRASFVFNITIPTRKEDQEDLLVARDTAKLKPTTGELSLRFKHILSKVNFTVSTEIDGDLETGLNHKAYVLAVGFCNLFKTSAFSAVGDSWSAPSDIDTFNYYNAFKPLTGTATYPEKMFVEADKDSIFPSVIGSKHEHLMLLPQKPTVWEVNAKTAPSINDAHIRMLYRLETNDAGKPDSIGFSSAIWHDDYPSSTTETAGYTGPLYVLVGYAYMPSSDPLKGWESGKGYSYNIPIPGVGGGILLDLNLYDNQGNKTDLMVPERNRRLFGPVIANGSNSIQLPPEVSDWTDQASTNVTD